MRYNTRRIGGVPWGKDPIGSVQFLTDYEAMKTLGTVLDRIGIQKIRGAAVRNLVTALAVMGTFLVLDPTAGRAEEAATGDGPGVQVLTRGPVHEAFAGIVTANPEAGVVVPKAPPATIEELPPDERPEGANVTRIPGYWAWDDERADFLWVSGVWRALPPGRQWVAGYWGKAGTGYQWTAGYWADAATSETTYLPAPPATVEAGPNIAAPSADYDWSPGCWVWFDNRYAWRPGYWMAGRSDWNWCPAYYAWTPRGYVFIDGYWDYSIERRGVLFAPVYFDAGVYSRRGYFYSPSIVIDLGVFADDLFLRPSYHHYYFGDYYATGYSRGGFYAAFSFQSGRHGYDPIYAHQRWEHRDDREWAHRVQTTYTYRREHADARPPRTWAAQQNLRPNAQSKENHLVVAKSLDQLSKQKDGPVRFQPVAREEKQQLVQRGQEVRKSRDERQTLEAAPGATSNVRSNQKVEPSTVKLPRSPIVAQPADPLGKNQAPPSPRQISKPDQGRAKPVATRPESKAIPDNLQGEPAKAAHPEKSVPAKPESKPEVERPVKHEAQPEVPKPEPKVVPNNRPPEPARVARPEKPVPNNPEPKPEVERPVRQKQDDGDRGGTRNDNRSQENKGDGQRTTQDK